MTVAISKSDLKPKLLSYLRELETSKEPIIVTDHGRPVAKIIPYEQEEEDVLKLLIGTVLAYDDPFAPVAEDDWDLK